jgi:glutathione S-transferase
MTMAYELYYWPSIQGRGEFVRLALEHAGADYVDVARSDGSGQGVKALMRGLHDGDRPPFAPPYLRDGDVVIGQTAAILFYLGPRLNLVPRGEADRLWVHQIQLTLCDLVNEAHDTHHPVGMGLYYEDQKAEALRRAKEFREERIPKYLGWLEKLIQRNPADGGWLAGDAPTYADLSAFQVVEGLNYAFPNAARSAVDAAPALRALAARVKSLPRIAAYLASDRRIAFNRDGIFRAYPELDGPAAGED